MNKSKNITSPFRWVDDALELLDQTRLPREIRYVRCCSVADVIDAIAKMIVRGAPAIGIAAAYGVALAARERFDQDGKAWRERIRGDLDALRATRPTAVNLDWALKRISAEFDSIVGEPYPQLLTIARRLHADDIAANINLGANGAKLILPGSGVLTHCNAGALATAGFGTALGVIRSAWVLGHLSSVFVTETRPWLQGARLTAWELMQDDIPVTLIADMASAYLMQQGRIDWVITGADRIAANGDTANKIGTYALATLARAHNVKFMIAAPTSTIDRDTSVGDHIRIECRPKTEVTHVAGQEMATRDVEVFNPVFDVTPAHLIDFLVTEKGVVERPNREAIQALFND